MGLSVDRRLALVIHYSRSNYGNHLVNFAARRILERCGYDVDLLVLEGKNSGTFAASLARLPEKLRRLGIRKSISRVLGRVSRLVQAGRDGGAMRPESRDRIEKFRIFADAHLRPKFVDVRKRRNLRDSYRIFAVGSDQIWNYDYGLAPWHFLDFADGRTMVTISPSVGHDEIPREWLRFYRRWLARFDEVGIRELEWTTSLGMASRQPQFTLLIDPTLVLTRQEWTSIARAPRWPSRTLLLYTLGEMLPRDRDFVHQAAKAHNLDVVHLSPRVRGPVWDSDASDFIGMIENAECVITDSYHGAIFAFMFDRPLVLLRRHGFAGAMNSRVETLIRECHLSDRVIDRLKPDEVLSHDYSRGRHALEDLRAQFWAYLGRQGLAPHLAWENHFGRGSSG